MTELTEPHVDVLLRVVGNAPSVHNIQPWELDVVDRTVVLFSRQVELPSHDPAGRDRMMSFGAALTNAELALRDLGYEAVVDTRPRSFGTDAIATVTAGTPYAATAEERRLYGAIERRRSYRHVFRPDPVPDAVVRDVADAARRHGVEPRVLSDRAHIAALASLLGHATLALREDRIYQRELSAWLIRENGVRPDYPDGIPDNALGDESLPAAGLVRTGTPVPDDSVLAARIAAENTLILSTPGDTREDHLAAGRALQRAWLDATAAGLAASVITQPLHLIGFQDDMRDRLELPGLPQVILRFGYPAAEIPAPPRRPHRELLRRHDAGR